MSTCVAPLSETMGVEEHAEADRSLQDKPVDKQLSADHLSTCVAPSPTINPDFVTIFEFSFTYLRTSIERS